MFTMCIKPIFEIVLVGIAGAFTHLNYKVSWVLFGFLILWPLQRKLMFYLRRRCASDSKREKKSFLLLLFQRSNQQGTSGSLHWCCCCYHCLCFDSRYHSRRIPNCKESPWRRPACCSETHDVRVQKLLWNLLNCLSVVVCETTLSSIFFHTVDFVILYLQKIFLAFLCLIPIGSNMRINFQSGKNSQVPVLWASGMTFIPSIIQVLMLVWGYYREEKLLHSWATCSEQTRSSKMNRRQFLYVRWKSANIPFWCVVGFFRLFFNRQYSGYHRWYCHYWNSGNFHHFKVCVFHESHW